MCFNILFIFLRKCLFQDANIGKRDYLSLNPTFTHLFRDSRGKTEDLFCFQFVDRYLPPRLISTQLVKRHIDLFKYYNSSSCLVAELKFLLELFSL